MELWRSQWRSGSPPGRRRLGDPFTRIEASSSFHPSISGIASTFGILLFSPVVMTRDSQVPGRWHEMEGYMPKLHELQERRAHAVSEMRAINDTAEREQRDYSADE